MANNRPTGVTILAVLYILGGILSFAGAAALGGIATMVPVLGALLGGLVAVVFIVVGIIALLMAYGYLKGMKWSWWLSLVLLVIGIIFGLASLFSNPLSGVISIVIDAIVIYYITRKNVKAFFGMK